MSETKRDDGGAAFPTGFQPENCAADCGMSLRDYFASAALTGSLAAEAHPESRGIVPLEDGEADGRALTAYQLADAMLKARAK